MYCWCFCCTLFWKHCHSLEALQCLQCQCSLNVCCCINAEWISLLALQFPITSSLRQIIFWQDYLFPEISIKLTIFNAVLLLLLVLQCSPSAGYWARVLMMVLLLLLLLLLVLALSLFFFLQTQITYLLIRRGSAEQCLPSTVGWITGLQTLAPFPFLPLTHHRSSSLIAAVSRRSASALTAFSQLTSFYQGSVRDEGRAALQLQLVLSFCLHFPSKRTPAWLQPVWLPLHFLLPGSVLYHTPVQRKWAVRLVFWGGRASCISGSRGNLQSLELDCLQFEIAHFRCGSMFAVVELYLHSIFVASCLVAPADADAVAVDACQ